MTRSLIGLAGICGFVLCAGYPAANAAGLVYPATLIIPTNPTATSGEFGANPVVCKTGPAPTGTRLGTTRVCHLQGEWDVIQQEQRRQLTVIQIQRGTIVLDPDAASVGRGGS